MTVNRLPPNPAGPESEHAKPKRVRESESMTLRFVKRCACCKAGCDWINHAANPLTAFNAESNLPHFARYDFRPKSVALRRA